MGNRKIRFRDDYFAKTVWDDYADPFTAIIREYFQNHIDSFLKVNQENPIIKFIVKGNKFISTDNGVGMDHNTLDTVLLELLETDKGKEFTGGKGRAKELLYFAHPEWKVHTGNLIAEGSYMTKDIHEISEYHQGTKNIITFDRDIEKELFKAFKEFISKCSFDPVVTWNGERFEGMGRIDQLELIRASTPSALNEEKKQELFERMGMVDFQYKTYKMPKTGRDVLIRSNGIYMFSDFLRKDMGMIFEIAPGISKYVLTGNRDGFKSLYSDTYNLVKTLDGNWDGKGEQRGLFGEPESDDDFIYKIRNNSLMLSNSFNGTIEYQKDVNDLFFDHNLDGAEIKIELDSVLELDGNQFTYLGGDKAKWSDDINGIVFDNIYFSDKEDFEKNFKFSDVVLMGRIESIEKIPCEKNVLGAKEHDGKLVIYDYKIANE